MSCLSLECCFWYSYFFVNGCLLVPELGARTDAKQPTQELVFEIFLHTVHHVVSSTQGM
jgi:hypothetical protein